MKTATIASKKITSNVDDHGKRLKDNYLRIGTWNPRTPHRVGHCHSGKATDMYLDLWLKKLRHLVSGFRNQDKILIQPYFCSASTRTLHRMVEADRIRRSA